jgi:HK97 family phage major capsid protein
MPSTLTKGTSNGVCHGAILGDFSQVVIAYWGALEVIVDPYTDAAKGLVHITSTLYVDVGVIQPGAFAVIRDLTLA